MRTSVDTLKKLGLRPALLVTALVFLCNPHTQGLDILPDFVGYLLLVAALRRIALLDESFAEASRLLRRAAWLSVAQLVGLVWIFTVPSAEEQPTLVLLLCFTVGILEWITLLPACRQLFHGLSYIGSRHGAAALFAVTRRARGTDITDRACRRSQVFLIVRVVLGVVPELASLTDASYRAGATLFNWYAYVHGLRAMAVVAGLAVGVVWLVRMLRYVSTIAKDKPFWATLLSCCEQDEAAHPERIPAAHLKRACTLAILAFAFCINFSVDGINLIPGVITPILLLISLGMIGRYLPALTRWLCVGVLSLHTVVSGVVYFMTTHFFARYNLYAYYREIKVQTAYDAVCTGTVVEAVSFVLVLITLGYAAWVLALRYTGAHGAATFCYTKEQIVRVRQRQLMWHLFPVLLFGVLTAASHTVCAYLLIEYDFVWLIDMFVAALLLIFAFFRLRDFCDELDPKKML